MTLGELAAAAHAALAGDGAILIHAVAPLEQAGQRDLAPAWRAKPDEIARSRAGALILQEGQAADRPALISANPPLTLARTLELLNPELPAAAPGVSPRASVGPGVVVGAGVHVGDFAVIGGGARLDDGALVLAGAKIGAGCVIGRDTVMFENVVLSPGTVIGARCRIHAGSVIGADGFGYARAPGNVSYKIPQRGIVRIGDEVEIGACVTVDRATLGETVIGGGVKIDDHCHIGHNCVIGARTIIAGCSGIAGSATIGEDVVIAGDVAVSDHVTIARGVIVTGGAGVHTNLTEPGMYGGPLVMKHRDYLKFMLSGRRLDKLETKIKELEQRTTRS